MELGCFGFGDSGGGGSSSLVPATVTQINTGTDNAAYVTALGLQGSKYLDQSGSKTYIALSGTNTITGTVSPAITAYATGQIFHVKAAATTTGAATLNLNSLGAKNIYINPTTAAGAGAFLINQHYVLVYDSSLDSSNGGFIINGTASNLFVQTAANWAADTTVYSAQSMLITSDDTYGNLDQRKFKIANGTDTWSNLDYFPVVGLSISWGWAALSPADATTYRPSPIVSLAAATTSQLNRQIQLPFAAIAREACITWTGTAGSNEGVTLRIANITAGTTFDFTTSMDWSTSPNCIGINGGTLSGAANDRWEIQIVTPTWTSNPASIQIAVEVTFNLN